MRQVWPETAVEENNITVAISALRRALGETASATKWIVTIPGRGYSFVGLAASQPLRSVAILPFSVLNQNGRNSTWALDWPTLSSLGSATRRSSSGPLQA